MSNYEVNFDGLVGPTHHFAGLSFGNQASIKNRNLVSNPKLAAKQGLLKMNTLAKLGIKQGVLAPQERPHIASLRQLGFLGSDQQVITQAMHTAPELLSALSSASSMWVANAATVSPSADSADGRVHFTTANLNNKFHRSIESTTTGRILSAVFRDEQHFTHHQALPAVALFGDEGAANHNRLCGDYTKAGIQVFVYGQQFIGGKNTPKRYPARQSLEASKAIARLHQLNPERTVFIQQNPDVIDQGVFHNDVIAVSNQQVLFYHQDAFLYQLHALDEIRHKMALLEHDLLAIEVPRNRVNVSDAVNTYLFNSQLVTRPDQGMTLVLPQEAREHSAVWDYLNDLLQMDNPIDDLQVVNLNESMGNGGGPACLRLRVALNQAELQAVNERVLMNDTLFARLNIWIDRYYRDRLEPQDLADPALLIENRHALDELTQILSLGCIYDFQR